MLVISLNGTGNATHHTSLNRMADQSNGYGWLHYIIILVCVVVTQVVAYFASPADLIEAGRYFLNYIAFYTIAVQWIVFIHAGGFFGNERTEKFYDLTGSLTYISTLAISLILSYSFVITYSTINVRQIILSVFVFIWSARLGWFLFGRIKRSGIDSRFTVIKTVRSRFLMAWTLQVFYLSKCSRFSIDFLQRSFIAGRLGIFGHSTAVDA